VLAEGEIQIRLVNRGPRAAGWCAGAPTCRQDCARLSVAAKKASLSFPKWATWVKENRIRQNAPIISVLLPPAPQAGAVYYSPGQVVTAGPGSNGKTRLDTLVATKAP